MSSSEIDRLIQLLAKLPGLGPRSARRAALHLIKRRESLLSPLADAMHEAADAIKTCSVCGNLDTRDPCSVCADPRRDGALICVVEEVGDLWALERTGSFKGLYHVLGGTLSALDEVGLAHFRSRQLPTLSGGEQQRAHFARVLVQLACGEALHGPGLLLLDEPTSSLDLRHQIDLVETARRRAAREQIE